MPVHGKPHSSTRLAAGGVAVAMFVLFATACVGHRRPADPGVTAIRSGGSTVSVVNRQWIDLRVYVMTPSGASYRLGIVPRLGRGTFTLPSDINLPAELTFAAVPLGIDDPQFVGPVEVGFGSRLLFTIDAGESGSSVVKRP